jgi:SAM-dependent methyltransferase
MQQNQEVVTQWTQSAPYWEKHREMIAEMFAPVTRALIDDAAIAPGSTVLDVATGPGEPALTIAEVVGPAGRVVGTDAVQDMVEAARREGRRRGFRNASFEPAFADELPLPDSAFDAVVSRFGVMFFPSPLDAVRECLRVLKAGGRIAFAVWHYAERNPFHYVLSRVMDRYAPPTPPTPGAPDAFLFAQPGKLQAVLVAAGVTGVSERLLQFPIRAALSPAKFWDLRREMSEKMRTKLAKLSQPQIAKLETEVIAALGEYYSAGAIVFAGEVLIVSGSKAP